MCHISSKLDGFLLSYRDLMIFKMANGRHFNFLNVHIMSHGCHRLPNILPVHQILSKSDDLSLIYAELTICKMAAVRQLEFSKFRVYVNWPLLLCYSASLCKISLKSDNRLLSYGQKQLLK